MTNANPATNRPAISLLMPVYNASPYLRESMQSILNQSFRDFEVIAIDDGSTDDSWSVLQEFSRSDERIRLFKNDKNEGWIRALHQALKEARGKFIARQDADDRSLPERFQRQVDFLLNHPDVVLCGSTHNVIDANGSVIETLHPAPNDTQIRWEMLFFSPFAHTSVMFRHDVLQKNNLTYDEKLRHAEDFQLWSDLLKFGKGANIPEPLVQYRLHDDQVTRVFEDSKQFHANRISQANLLKIGISLSIEDVDLLRQNYHSLSKSAAENTRICLMFFHVLDAFRRQPGLDPVTISQLQRKYTLRALKIVSLKNFTRNNLSLLLECFRNDASDTIRSMFQRSQFMRGKQKCTSF